MAQMTLNGAAAARPYREMDRAVAVPAEVTAAAGPASTREAQATAALVTGTGRAKGVHPRPVVVPVSPEADLALLAPAARGPAWAPARDRAPALLGPGGTARPWRSTGGSPDWPAVARRSRRDLPCTYQPVALPDGCRRPRRRPRWARRRRTPWRLRWRPRWSRPAGRQ